MGWKNIKEHFSIQHIVHIKNGKVCIGSPYINDLIIINSETGEIEKNSLDSKNIGYEPLSWSQDKFKVELSTEQLQEFDKHWQGVQEATERFENNYE
jgi:hypothetical protein